MMCIEISVKNVRTVAYCTYSCTINRRHWNDSDMYHINWLERPNKLVKYPSVSCTSFFFDWTRQSEAGIHSNILGFDNGVIIKNNR